MKSESKFRGIPVFLKNVSKEMKKVSWPKKKELTNATITVLITVTFVTLFILLVDFGIGELLNLFL